MTPGMQTIADEMAEAAFAALSPRIRSLFAELATQAADPLLTAEQAGKRIGLSGRTVRFLVQSNLIKTAPGLTEIRIKQSVADAYGKPEAKK